VQEGQHMNEFEMFLRFSFLGLSTLISIISLLSLKKTKEMKIAFASIGFLIFAIEGFIVSIGVFLPVVETMITTSMLVGFTLIALIFFYLSILKR
jgi:hydrogenase/urease accessory protein HupE